MPTANCKNYNVSIFIDAEKDRLFHVSKCREGKDFDDTEVLSDSQRIQAADKLIENLSTRRFKDVFECLVKNYDKIEHKVLRCNLSEREASLLEGAIRSIINMKEIRCKGFFNP